MRRTRLVAAAAAVIFTSLLAPASASIRAAAGPDVGIEPAAISSLASQAAPLSTAECEQMFFVACYVPDQIQRAYDLGRLFRRGIDGAGQTIAVVDAFGSPTIASDLATFDQAFHLPRARLKVIQPVGPVPPFDPSDATMEGWADETTLDVEWAHVMAPAARILLVETPVAETVGAAGFSEIVEAENYVIDHHLAEVISQSFQTTEQTFTGLQALQPLRSAYINAAQHNVTVLASAGDQGASGPENEAGTLFPEPVTAWPPSDPLVTGVGGTQLHLDAAGNRTAPDNVWNDTYNVAVNKELGNPTPSALASGGGKSVFFSRPNYQNSVASVVGGSRGVPDISMSAACSGSVEIYLSFPGPNPGWYLTCGTSESTPLFAGVVALADQMAGHPLGLINRQVYSLAAAGAPGIVDITSGNNTVSFVEGGKTVTVTGFSAGPGYDLASGVGTVDAGKFVPELVAASRQHHPHPYHRDRSRHYQD
jgi:subtilase family serine protease